MWRHGLGVVCVASLVGLSGCMGVNTGPETGGGPMGPVCQGHYGKSYGPSTIPGMQGPYGEKLAKSPMWPGDVPMNPYQARQQMANHVPLEAVQMSGAGVMPAGMMTPPGGSMPNFLMPAGGLLSPPGVPGAPGAPSGMPMPPDMRGGGSGVVPADFRGAPGGGVMPAQYNPTMPADPRGTMPPFPPGMGGMPMGGAMPPLPPPGMGGGMGGMSMGGGMPPFPPSGMGGGMPAIGPTGMNPMRPSGPGGNGADPGVMQAQLNCMPGVVAAMPMGPGGNGGGGGAGPRFVSTRTQIRFEKPNGMSVSWLTQGPDGKPAYSNPPLFVPAKYNFGQGAIYQLKLFNIPGRPAGFTAYPTLEVVPSNSRTEEFLAHSYIRIEFTEQDFDQIVDGNYVVKVVYLPDPQFQELAGPGVIISTQLDPGMDPIKEAVKRGSVLLIIRMGSIDQEAPNTPPLKGQPRPQANPGGMGMMPNFGAVPVGGMSPAPPYPGLGPAAPYGPMGPSGPIPPYGFGSPPPAASPGAGPGTSALTPPNPFPSMLNTGSVPPSNLPATTVPKDSSPAIGPPPPVKSEATAPATTTPSAPPSVSSDSALPPASATPTTTGDSKGPAAPSASSTPPAISGDTAPPAVTSTPAATGDAKNPAASSAPAAPATPPSPTATGAPQATASPASTAPASAPSVAPPPPVSAAPAPPPPVTTAPNSGSPTSSTAVTPPASSVSNSAPAVDPPPPLAFPRPASSSAVPPSPAKPVDVQKDPVPVQSNNGKLWPLPSADLQSIPVGPPPQLKGEPISPFPPKNVGAASPTTVPSPVPTVAPPPKVETAAPATGPAVPARGQLDIPNIPSSNAATPAAAAPPSSNPAPTSTPGTGTYVPRLPNDFFDTRPPASSLIGSH